MFFANVVKRWNVRLTVIDKWEGSRDWIIGQFWEYATKPPDKREKNPEPEFFLFSPKRIPDFEPLSFDCDGRSDKAECLEWVKGQYRKLQQTGIVKHDAKMIFTMAPLEQVI